MEKTLSIYSHTPKQFNLIHSIGFLITTLRFDCSFSQLIILQTWLISMKIDFFFSETKQKPNNRQWKSHNLSLKFHISTIQVHECLLKTFCGRWLKYWKLPLFLLIVRNLNEMCTWDVIAEHIFELTINFAFSYPFCPFARSHPLPPLFSLFISFTLLCVCENTGGSLSLTAYTNMARCIVRV